MKVVPLQLKPGEDLHRELEAWMGEQHADSLVPTTGCRQSGKINLGNRRQSFHCLYLQLTGKNRKNWEMSWTS
jgi:hypothetical protein